METKEIKLKRGPKPGNPEHKATEMLGIRVTASVKNIYQSLADNFGISETDLFYQYVHHSYNFISLNLSVYYENNILLHPCEFPQIACNTGLCIF